MNSTAPRWVATGIVAAAFAVAGYQLVLGPTIEGIFSNVADDHCKRLAGGEPDRNDPDCYTGEWDGRNYVEEWGRAHPADKEDVLRWAGENALGLAALTVALVVGVPTLYFAWRGWRPSPQRPGGRESASG